MNHYIPTIFCRLATVLVIGMVSLDSSAQSTFSVDYNWSLVDRCSSASPELRITGIPAGTNSLEITLVDHDAPNYSHGGGIIATVNEIKELTVEKGSLKNYRGPCPPNFSSFGHDYSFVVKARSSTGELASATKLQNFSASKVK